MQLTDERGTLVGAVVVSEEDQIMAIMKSGKVIRSNVSEVKLTGRTTQGVTLAKPDAGDEIISIARNAETEDEADGDTVVTESSAGSTETQLAQGEPVFEVKSEDGMPVIEEESAAIDKTYKRPKKSEQHTGFAGPTAVFGRSRPSAWLLLQGLETLILSNRIFFSRSDYEQHQSA